MTATVARPANRATLTKLAVVYAEAGFGSTKAERERRLAHATAFVGRALSSSAELSQREAGALIEALERGGRTDPGGGPVAPSAAVGELQPPDPTEPAPDPVQPRCGPGESPIGIRRGPYGCGAEGLHWVTPDPERTTYCPCGTVAQVPNRGSCAPNRCYCRHCPGWRPVPPIDYRRAIAELAEKARVKLERRTRPGSYRGRR